jgi:hypothetical protein
MQTGSKRPKRLDFRKFSVERYGPRVERDGSGRTGWAARRQASEPSQSPRPAASVAPTSIPSPFASAARRRLA